MLFNSYVFIFAFLPITALLFFVLGRLAPARVAVAWLVACSLFFYGWWNPAYLALIGFSILFNFLAGRLIVAFRGRHRPHKAMLVAGVAVNLGLLGYFKYVDFFIVNINAAVGAALEPTGVVLPLAISFFTFQQIAYLVDTYRDEVDEHSFLSYMLFVLFFPQLIAGPIVHHKDMLPQFAKAATFRMRYENLAIGLSVFCVGLFKKVVLADGVAVYASPVFAAADGGATLTLVEAWGGALAYALQLYFDFSGYSDMAIGLARIFGIQLPLNFNSPYKAASISDFWRRWHMTLSRFLRDYVYIALGGNRRGEVRRYVNLAVTMLLGGLWHGAGWTFVLWGGLHGAYLVIDHALARGLDKIAPRRHTLRLWRPACVLVTFLAVLVGWVFFRATTFDGAIAVLAGMSGANGVLLPAGYAGYFGPLLPVLEGLGWRFETDPGRFAGASQVFMITALLAICWLAPNTQQWFGHFTAETGPAEGRWPLLRWRPNVVTAAYVSVLATWSILSLNSISEFLYFQF